MNLTTITTFEYQLEPLLKKLNLSKVLRVTATIKTYVYNCENSNTRTEDVGWNELQEANKFWIKRTQHWIEENEKFKEIEKGLQLIKRMDI